MPKKRLADAGVAFKGGNMHAVVELLNAEVIDAADNRDVADRIRFVRAFALLNAGNAQAASVVIDGMEPARQQTRSVLRLSAAAALAARDMTKATNALAMLVKAGDREAILVYQSALVRRGLDAIAARDYGVALESLRAA